MSVTIREFRRTGVDQSLAQLLSSVLASELLWPSKRLWLVSPWIGDIAILDNSTGAYGTVVPEWERAAVRLSQVLIYLASQGTEVVVALRGKDPNNAQFQAALSEVVSAPSSRIRIFSERRLHEKGMLGDGFYLKGSFNFTWSGMQINEEMVSFVTDPSQIAEARVDFAERWKKEDDSS